ncbi:unnamed protein product [Hymenolepis diminuta]|uniref:WD_REPEATS_REGION domain-containing protein n=1 Tax=Hymenolepis diminuta TaxID=6216 RepID=A0A0R3SDH6_HYMDI|nr:unnamed protein product [Hymenolepis diminuta]
MGDLELLALFCIFFQFFSPTGTTDGVIFINELDGRAFMRLHALTGHTSSVSCHAVSTNSLNPHRPDDSGLFVSGGWDGNIRLWNALTGECLRVFDGKLILDHRTSVEDALWRQNMRINAISFCKDCILSANWRGGIISRRINDAEDNNTCFVRNHGIVTTRIEHYGKWLVSINHRSIVIVDLEDESNNRELEQAFSADGDEVIVDFKSSQIIYANKDNIFTYNIRTKEVICFQKSSSEPMLDVTAIQANENFVYTLNKDCSIYLWDGKFKLIDKICELPKVGMDRCHLTLSESSQRMLCVLSYHTLQGIMTNMYMISLSQPVIEES